MGALVILLLIHNYNFLPEEEDFEKIGTNDIDDLIRLALFSDIHKSFLEFW